MNPKLIIIRVCQMHAVMVHKKMLLFHQYSGICHKYGNVVFRIQSVIKDASFTRPRIHNVISMTLRSQCIILYLPQRACGWVIRWLHHVDQITLPKSRNRRRSNLKCEVCHISPFRFPCYTPRNYECKKSFSSPSQPLDGTHW